MRFSTQIALGVGLIGVGAVLLVRARDTDFFAFQGQPLGVVLVILGAVDVVEALLRRRRSAYRQQEDRES
jgi:drug/metabolite transporter (DMT)-like permease